MRTTAEAQNSPAAPAAEPGSGRRPRAAARLQAAPTEAPQPGLSQPSPVAVTTVRVLQLDEGLHALRIGEIAGTASVVAGMAVPAAQVALPVAAQGNPVEIVASFPGRGPWLGRSGGTMILRSPPGGGSVVVTVYDAPGRAAADLSLDLQRLAGPGEAAAEGVAEPDAEPAADRDVPTEILLHIERAGDRLFPGRGWVGALGRRMRIEAFSIRPLEGLAPADLEMKGFLPNGGETPWIPGGILCGTRGRGLPLIGFAVRVVPQRADRFEVVYQGSFFAGGISDLHQNGDPCMAASADDPLEAINVRVIERGAGPEPVEAAG